MLELRLQGYPSDRRQVDESWDGAEFFFRPVVLDDGDREDELSFIRKYKILELINGNVK